MASACRLTSGSRCLILESQMPQTTWLITAIAVTTLTLPTQGLGQSSAVSNDGKRTSAASSGVKGQNDQRRAPETNKKSDMAKKADRQKAEIERLKREMNERNDAHNGFEKFVGGLVGDDSGAGSTSAKSNAKMKGSVATGSSTSKGVVVPCGGAANPCPPK
jgi:hypothetical protein